jgi:hypothetical protein
MALARARRGAAVSWLRQQIAPSPHLLDPAATEEAAYRYYTTVGGGPQLRRQVADQLRAIEHEEALARGMVRALEAQRCR